MKHHFITPGDWIRYRFHHQQAGSALRFFIALSFCLALINFLFAQLKAAGEVLDVMTNGAMPYEAGVVIFALIILAYDALGGLRAVAWTDVIQGLIMLAGFACLTVWLLNNMGGMEQLTLQIAELRPDNHETPSDNYQLKWFCLILLGGFSVAIYPQALQRIFAARSDQALHRSLASMGIITFLTTLVVLFTGWGTIPLVNVDSGPIADQVLPRLLELWAASSAWHGVGAMMVMLAILAAIMSTADSVLLSLVSMLRHDLTRHSNRHGLKYDNCIAVIIMVPIVLLALNRDVTLWRLVEIKLELLVQCFPAFVLTLHWKKLHAISVLTGLICGLLIVLLSLCTSVIQFYGINAGLIALAANLIMVCVMNGFIGLTGGIRQSS